jgi:hypothetical protein
VCLCSIDMLAARRTIGIRMHADEAPSVELTASSDRRL